jgi:hypothetical protein
MPSQDVLRIVSGVSVGTILFSSGLWLFYRGMLRARHLIYVHLPLSLVLTVLAASIWIPLLPTWRSRLLFSVIGAALIWLPVPLIFWMKGIDIDEWDRRRDN